MTTIRVRLYVVPTRDREDILVFIQHFVVLELELGWNWVGIGLELGWNWVGIGLELAVIGPLETI